MTFDEILKMEKICSNERVVYTERNLPFYVNLPLKLPLRRNFPKGAAREGKENVCFLVTLLQVKKKTQF